MLGGQVAVGLGLSLTGEGVEGKMMESLEE